VSPTTIPGANGARSSQLDKETIARNILAQDGVSSGLVCVLSCIEPCWKFLVFRGHLRSIATPQGMMNYLWRNHIFLKDFGGHVEKVTERLKEASLAEAKACRRPVKYLNSSQILKVCRQCCPGVWR
jgi:hypothetical protein